MTPSTAGTAPATGTLTGRVLVTGAAGYLGGALLRRLAGCGWSGELVGLDRVAPADPVEGVTYLRGEMPTDAWSELIAAQRAEVVVHLAFVVNPMRDEAAMRRINVEGTRRTLEAAIAGGARQLLFASSGTAYGALADNPVPLREEDPIRGDRCAYRYARDKAELERYCVELARRHPELKVAVVRPVIVYGRAAENFLSRFLFALPVLPLIDGGRTPFQFVHEQDVAGVMAAIIARGASGPFNVAGEGWLTMREICRLAGRPTISLPRAVVEGLLALAWRAGLERIEVPPTILDYMQHPWVLDTRRVTEELGYRMRYSSREALLEMLRTRTKR